MTWKPRLALDVHWHHIPREVVSTLADEANPSGERIVEEADGSLWLTFLGQTHRHPVTEADMSIEVAIAEMDRRGMDGAVVSPAATLYFYNIEGAATLDICQTINDSLAKARKEHPDRVYPIGTVPLQSPDLAVRELERMMSMGLYGVEIESHCNDWNLDVPELLPFFERAAELGAFIFVHPVSVLAPQRLSRHYLTNLIGNPTENCIAIESLIFGGVLDHVPNLRICFPHGGGAFPYLVGRADHAFEVRAECRLPQKRPSEYANQILCDSLAHSDEARAYEISVLGSRSVVLGSDYPYDMGDPDPVGSLARTPGLDDAQREDIAGNNLARALGLSAGDVS